MHACTQNLLKTFYYFRNNIPNFLLWSIRLYVIYSCLSLCPMRKYLISQAFFFKMAKFHKLVIDILDSVLSSSLARMLLLWESISLSVEEGVLCPTAPSLIGREPTVAPLQPLIWKNGGDDSLQGAEMCKEEQERPLSLPLFPSLFLSLRISGFWHDSIFLLASIL